MPTRVETISDTLEWLRFIATILTPFAVAALTIYVATRNHQRETLKKALNELTDKIDQSQKECREDIKAVAVQSQAFQREIFAFQERVASTYTPRAEIYEALRDLRNEIRNRNRSQ